MKENPNCTDCGLHARCSHVCMPGLGDSTCKLAIYLDHPNFVEDRTGRSWTGDNALFVNYCLRRMSIDPSLVYRDYIVKCAPIKMPGVKADRMAMVAACSQYRFATLQLLPQLAAMVVLGSLGCETITHSKSIGEKQGAEWVPVSPLMQQHIAHVWVGYSPGLVREKPAESGAIFRVIWRAAEEAGLNPTVADIAPYEFPD